MKFGKFIHFSLFRQAEKNKIGREMGVSVEMGGGDFDSLNQTILDGEATE